jgi:hypothetical protein
MLTIDVIYFLYKQTQQKWISSRQIFQNLTNTYFFHCYYRYNVTDTQLICMHWFQEVSAPLQLQIKSKNPQKLGVF